MRARDRLSVRFCVYMRALTRAMCFSETAFLPFENLWRGLNLLPFKETCFGKLHATRKKEINSIL